MMPDERKQTPSASERVGGEPELAELVPLRPEAAAESAPPVGEVSNASLLDGLQQGVAGAGTLLYDRFERVVSRLVWRMLGPDHEHEDVVQQVFLNALRAVHRVRNADALRAWMEQATVNTVRQELRTRGRRRSWLVFGEQVLELAEQPGYRDDRELVAGRFYAVLRTLKPDDQLVFVLCYLEDNTQAEIAEMCGCSLATVKRRLTRARERFRKRARRDFVLASYFDDDKQGSPDDA